MAYQVRISGITPWMAWWLCTSVGFAQPHDVDTLRVTVHDHEMVLYLSGTTGPLVVLEAGGGASHRCWDAVYEEMSTHARILRYDRPGYGASAPCSSPRTAHRIAEELDAALRSVGLDGPLFMAGWSHGGSIARVFAGRYPDRIRGLLLIDPAPEYFYERAARMYPDEWTSEYEMMLQDLCADDRTAAGRREMAGFDTSLEQAKASDGRYGAPVLLLIAGQDGAPEGRDAISQIWIDTLLEWASMNPGVVARMVPGSGHHIAREQPDAVIKALRELVATVPSDR
jgi:pimeloyl-ACP methyl ester carboxylesterase